MSIKQKPTERPAPSPQAGGRYQRNADGSLTLVQQTKPAPPRRPPPDLPVPADSAAAPAPASSAPAPQLKE